MLEESGATLHRSGGKHIIYRHPKVNRNIVITKAKTVSFGVYKQTQSILASV